MPTGRTHPIQFVRGGDWNARNESALLHPGEIMQKATINDNDYQTVQLDTGATSAVPQGAQAANELAYWKDRSVGLVTHDARVAEMGIDSLCGVFPCVVTPGNYTAIKTGRSRNVSVKVDGSTFAKGDSVKTDTAANGPQGTQVGSGTAVAQGQFLGKAKGAAVANVLAVDLQLPDFD